MIDEHDRAFGWAAVLAVVFIVLLSAAFAEKVWYKLAADAETPRQVARLVVAQERTNEILDSMNVELHKPRDPQPDAEERFYVCKRLPKIGQINYIKWIKENGGCEQVFNP